MSEEVIANKKESTVARWAGYVILPDYMTFVELREWQKAIDQAKGLDEAEGLAAFYQALLPFACKMVKEWHIKGLPEKVDVNTFPANTSLVGWLIDCVSELFTQTNGTDPNSPAQS